MEMSNSKILELLKELRPNKKVDKEKIQILINEFENRYKNEPDPYKQYEGHPGYW